MNQLINHLTTQVVNQVSEMNQFRIGCFLLEKFGQFIHIYQSSYEWVLWFFV